MILFPGQLYSYYHIVKTTTKITNYIGYTMELGTLVAAAVSGFGPSRFSHHLTSSCGLYSSLGVGVAGRS